MGEPRTSSLKEGGGGGKDPGLKMESSLGGGGGRTNSSCSPLDDTAGGISPTFPKKALMPGPSRDPAEAFLGSASSGALKGFTLGLGGTTGANFLGWL